MLMALALYATALLTGAMAFFSFVVAPLTFIKLEAAVASLFIRALFPVYYLVIMLCGAVAAISFAIIDRPIAATAMAIVAAMAVLTRQGMIPRLDALRAAKDAGDEKAARGFKALHRVSVVINLVQLVIATCVLFTFVL